MKIVDPQNIMARFLDMANQFTRYANVGNLVIVLIIVLGVVSKPTGESMV